MEDAGRWALGAGARAAASANTSEAAVEHVARTLLGRYGVVFWRLLEREAPWLPPWRDLLRAYRRLEGRGEIRGGRFVAGFSGEQFALPEAVGALRENAPAQGYRHPRVDLGRDPLNLVGILTPGPRLPALTGNRLLYRDGVPIAMLSGGEVRFLEELDPAAEWEANKALLRARFAPHRAPTTKTAALPLSHVSNSLRAQAELSGNPGVEHGLMDVLNGMQNGPRGARHNTGGTPAAAACRR